MERDKKIYHKVIGNTENYTSRAAMNIILPQQQQLNNKKN